MRDAKRHRHTRTRTRTRDTRDGGGSAASPLRRYTAQRPPHTWYHLHGRQTVSWRRPGCVWEKVQVVAKKLQKVLVVSKKMPTFAPGKVKSFQVNYDKEENRSGHPGNGKGRQSRVHRDERRNDKVLPRRPWRGKRRHDWETVQVTHGSSRSVQREGLDNRHRRYCKCCQQ